MYRNNCNFSISRKKQMKKKSPTEDKKGDSKLKKTKKPCDDQKRTIEYCKNESKSIYNLTNYKFKMSQLNGIQIKIIQQYLAYQKYA